MTSRRRDDVGEMADDKVAQRGDSGESKSGPFMALGRRLQQRVAGASSGSPRRAPRSAATHTVDDGVLAVSDINDAVWGSARVPATQLTGERRASGSRRPAARGDEPSR